MGTKVALRRHQLKPYQGGSRSSNKEEEGNRDEVQQSNTLMVRREQPRGETVIGIQVVLAPGDCSGLHCLPPTRWLLPKRLDIGHQLRQLLFAELPLKRWHDGRITGHQLGARVED